MIKKLPSFFVVGAQKAGTTTLHDWLVQQPDICLPKTKETWFFNDDERYAMGIDRYLSQFPVCNEEAIAGEINPEYMFFEKTPSRIHQSIKSPKIIFLLRNPIDRAYSHYQMTVRRGYEKLSFQDALLAEKERLSGGSNIFNVIHYSYMARGRYCEQISRYHKVLPDAKFLYVKFDDMISEGNGYATYEGICNFIGVKSSPAIADRNVKSNQASMPRSSFLNKILYDKERPFLRTAASFMFSAIPSDIKLRIGSALDRWNQKPLEKKEEDKKVLIAPAEVLDFVQDEILRLEILTGLNLKDWIDNNKKRWGWNERTERV